MSTRPAALAEALRERYVLERELGHGGMATVWLARDLRHDRSVALKVLHPELAQTLGPERFQREIKLVARLQHPHILTVHDSGETAGQLWFTMPFVEGESLRDRLRRERQLPVDDALRIATEAARALEYAHQHGVIHRDIKPENLLLTTDGTTLVADFGIARALSASTEQLTETGLAIGTPAYMSPEQAAGDRNLDARTDVYALGTVLYEMLAGEPPYTGPTAQAVIAKRFSGEVASVRRVRPTVPEGIERAVTKALAMVPADRFATAAQFAVALRAATLPAPSAEFPTVRASASGRGTPAPAAASIAVLPFANLSADRENEYFADGMTEEITNALAKLENLRVASHTSSFAFKGREADIRRIGEQLNVRTVLEGSVRKAANHLRVTAQLIDVADGYHLWSERFDRELHDVFAIQDEIAFAIVETLKVKLGPHSGSQLVKPHTANLDAYHLFLEGRFHWNRRGAGLVKAVECFTRAIELDPAYAPAHAALADSYNLLGWYGMLSPHEAFPQARSAAETALALDEGLAEAHTSLAFTLMCYDWAWREAEREFQRTMELNHRYATAHHWYSEFLMAVGRLDEAIAEARTALELDPVGLIISTVVGMAYYFARDYERAIVECRRTLAMEPSFTPVMIWLGRAYIATGRYVEAVQIFEEERRLSGRTTTDAMRAIALSRASNAAAAERVLEELRGEAGRGYVSAFDFMILEEALGRRAAALSELARAMDERSTWLVWMRIDPLLDSLRGEPAFAAAVARLAAGHPPADG